MNYSNHETRKLKDFCQLVIPKIMRSELCVVKAKAEGLESAEVIEIVGGECCTGANGGSGDDAVGKRVSTAASAIK